MTQASHAPSRISIDQQDTIAQNLAQAQAQAVISLLSTNGQEVENGFMLNHALIIDAIWCVDTLIGNAQNALSKGVKA